MLEYKRARCAVAQLVNILDAVRHSVKLSGRLRKDGTPSKRRQLMNFINESGFYALVLGSKFPTAEKFKNWVTSDVLPLIRKTDGYIPVQQVRAMRRRFAMLKKFFVLKDKENLLIFLCPLWGAATYL